MSLPPNKELPWAPYPSEMPEPEQKPEKRCSVGFVAALLCVVVALTILLTYTLTWIYVRDRYVDQIQEQAGEIRDLEEEMLELEKLLASGDGSEFQKLEYLSLLFEYYSYYANSMDKEEMLDAVLKAYAMATGDDYAEYYTEEEYAALVQDNAGSSVGIGVSVVQTEIDLGGVKEPVYQIISVYNNSPALAAGLLVGDCVCGVKIDGVYRTVAEAGYTTVINAIRGEEGTQVELLVYRKENGAYTRMEVSMTRAAFVKTSVSYYLSELDPTVGVVHISEFDMTTPAQFKEAVGALQTLGVEKFVFDVRNNPGGDLQSIKAVLTYFLNDGDLILSSIDKDGNRVRSYYATAQTLTGIYAPCSVSAAEVGMYRDLDMVVLCNENTASAAEVFTSTLRDHKQTPVIGQTTFGKGIMQSYISLGMFSYGMYDGWVKMTTYAYVTASGVPYHGIGIAPDVDVALSEEAKTYHVYLLPQSLDDQLKAAIEYLNRN
ncbi:MAG: hypothetical protein IJW29_04110 [Clostridia bacterium]|nr:hypothetical protein [Clostridia bacterium]